MRSLVLSAILTMAFTAGCYTEGSVGYSYGYAAPGPDLVYVSPGVQVIADYDYPVFYSDNYYWRYDGGVWYRSSRWNGGWAVSYNVPVRVRGISRPGAYVHYHARGPYVRDHRRGEAYRRGPEYRRGPAYRGRPAYRAPAARSAPARRAPAVRDHRSAPARRGPVVRDHRR